MRGLRGLLAARPIHQPVHPWLALLPLLLLLQEQGEAAEKRLRFSTQIGVSQIAYQEDPGLAVLDQTTLHIKQGADFALIRDRLDLGANGYISGLANLSTSGNAQTAAPLYWGFSFRSSLSLSRKNSTWDFRVAPGYYLWGMIVENSGFGINLLGAPQLVLSLRNRKSGRRPLGFYIKVAPTSPDFDLLNSNRELALGLDWMLTKPQAKRPLTLHADFAETRYEKETGDLTQSLRFFSINLGLGIRW